MQKNNLIINKVILSKNAQTHIPGTLWSKDDPQIQIAWREFEDYVKIAEDKLEINSKKYQKELTGLSKNLDALRDIDEDYYETLSYANQSLREIIEDIDATCFDMFHNILSINADAKRKLGK